MIIEMVSASGKTLALAGTLCSPSVFQLLVDDEANPNETAAHCVIARNSLSKCTLLSNMKPNLSVNWMGNTAVEQAHIYDCKREIIDIFAKPRPNLNHQNQLKTFDDSKYDSDGFLHDSTNSKPMLSSKIHVGHHSKSTASSKLNALRSIKYNQYYMKQSRKEIEHMETELEKFFKGLKPHQIHLTLHTPTICIGACMIIASVSDQMSSMPF